MPEGTGTVNQKGIEFYSNLIDELMYWMTFNEASVFAGGGLAGGFHAPFEQNDVDTCMQITKNLLLAHGKAVRVIRRNCLPDVQIGYAPSNEAVIPKEMTEAGIEMARKETFGMRVKRREAA